MTIRAPIRLLTAVAVAAVVAFAAGCSADPLTPPTPAGGIAPRERSGSPAIDPATVAGTTERRLVRAGPDPMTVDTLHVRGATELDVAVDTLTLNAVERYLSARSAAGYTAALAPWGLADDPGDTLPTDPDGLIAATDLVQATGDVLALRVTATEGGSVVTDRVVYWDDSRRSVTPAADLVSDGQRAGLASAVGSDTESSLDSLAFAADGSASIRVAGGDDRVVVLPAEAASPFLTQEGRSIQSAAVSGIPFTPSTSDPEAAPHVPCALIACVALTYDDGPSPETTPALLDILRDEGVPATFFVEGRWASAYPDIIRRAAVEGHAIENHTWDHPDLATLSGEAVRDQIARTDAAVVAAGAPAPTLIRAPYGSAGGAVGSSVDKPLAFWSIDSFDWRDQDPRVFVPRLLAGIEPGGIALMHDVHASTVEGQRDLVDALRDRGYTFVTVPQLLAGTPLQAGVTYSCLGPGRAFTGPACTPAPGAAPQ